MKPPRVAWLGHKAAGGGDGIITYSRELTAGLRARGAEVFFFHHAPEADREGTSICLDGYRVSNRFTITRPASRRKLIQFLKDERVDVVHVSFSFSSLDFELGRLCREVGVPLVGTFHAPFDTRLSVWGGLSRVLYRLYSQALGGCDAVIIFGETQRDLLIKMGVRPSAVRVIPNGVDVERYAPGPSPKLAELGADRVFLYMGRIDPEKHVEDLLRVFLYVDPPPGVRLVVMGGGTEKRRLERRYRDPRVVFTGNITDEAERVAWLRAASAFFLPSSIEGLSLSMLEAMACGVATVATDVGSDGDALRGAGIVLEPDSLDEDLTSAIRLLIDVPEVGRVLGRLARERARDRFSLDRNIDGVLALYEELIGSRPAAVPASEPG